MKARARQRHSHRRPGRLQAALRVALVSLGTAGLSLGIASPATAQGDESHHEAMHGMMHGMMDAMHGEHTTARMHEAEGAEQMMQECSSMTGSMAAMGRMMGPMMGGGPRR